MHEYLEEFSLEREWWVWTRRASTRLEIEEICFAAKEASSRACLKLAEKVSNQSDANRALVPTRLDP
jgi:hypothetical protein